MALTGQHTADPKPKKLLRFEVERSWAPWLSGRDEEEVGMGKRGHTEEEILRVLREAEAGATVVEVCRKHGISQQSFYLWKKKYAGRV
jgi:hypothetical protein